MVEAFGCDMMASQDVTSKDVTKYMKVRHYGILYYLAGITQSGLVSFPGESGNET